MSELYTFDALKKFLKNNGCIVGIRKGINLFRLILKKLILMVKLILNQQEYSI